MHDRKGNLHDEIQIPGRAAPGQCAAVQLAGDRRSEKLALKLVIDDDVPAYVRGDVLRFRQVILNLLENALKFTPDGGQVSLKLLHRTNQWVQVSVSDTGPGIPTEEQQRIFQDRVRLPQTAGQAQGFGVGLSVCRRIVEVHGGRIWVVSDPGEGAAFHFTVPVWRGQAS